ncbi:MAG: tRNA (adenosine(37)-N6)-dimethylallyltransferase MiaA [Pseudomonadales bacterium]|nr:tRNA (adenosine(37)-N6)-dimethylallyltransferase MiaA [Pseudomonadales bacterium]
MGPTASGKTDLAIELCRQLPCDIISVDSALVYKGMDIGTAKPDAKTLEAYPHRLIDIRDPSQPYSAADFRADALAEMEDISAAGRIPLLVGGTMLYFKALRDGLAKLPESDPDVRAEIGRLADTKGWNEVHRQLALVDPVSAERIHPNDPQRLQRALEIYRICGQTLTELQALQIRENVLPYDLTTLAIIPEDRALLHQRIEQRFRQMIEQGFIEEVQELFVRPELNLNLPSIRAVGYRQVWQYLDGTYDQDQMIEKGIIATRQMAKRQLTWLRNNWHFEQISMEDPEKLNQALKFCSSITI